MTITGSVTLDKFRNVHAEFIATGLPLNPGIPVRANFIVTVRPGNQQPFIEPITKLWNGTSFSAIFDLKLQTQTITEIDTAIAFFNDRSGNFLETKNFNNIPFPVVEPEPDIVGTLITFTGFPANTFKTHVTKADFDLLVIESSKDQRWGISEVEVTSTFVQTFREVEIIIAEVLAQLFPPFEHPLRPVPQRDFHWQGINDVAQTGQFLNSINEVFNRFEQVIDVKWSPNTNFTYPPSLTLIYRHLQLQ